MPQARLSWHINRGNFPFKKFFESNDIELLSLLGTNSIGSANASHFANSGKQRRRKPSQPPEIQRSSRRLPVLNASSVHGTRLPGVSRRTVLLDF
jgi:hypothetical protein